MADYFKCEIIVVNIFILKMLFIRFIYLKYISYKQTMNLFSPETTLMYPHC